MSSGAKKLLKILASLLLALGGVCFITSFHLYRVGGCGYADPTGKMQIPPSFRNCEPFSEGLAGVRPGGYELRFQSNLIWASDSSSLCGFIDRTGNLVIKPQFVATYCFSEGLAAVQPKNSNKFGFIDKSGKFVIPAQFDEVGKFREGLAAVSTNTALTRNPSQNSIITYGYIDKTGAWIIPEDLVFPKSYFVDSFAETLGFSEGLAPYADKKTTDKQGYFGFIDTKGKVIVKPIYQQVRKFSKGVAGVAFAKGRALRELSEGCVEEFESISWGVIDHNGKVLVEPSESHAECWSAHDGRCVLVDRLRHGEKSIATGKMTAYSMVGGRLLEEEYTREPERAPQFADGLRPVDKGGSYIF